MKLVAAWISVIGTLLALCIILTSIVMQGEPSAFIAFAAFAWVFTPGMVLLIPGIWGATVLAEHYL